MVLGGQLTPVGNLSSAFLSPKSPLHLQFAYYESALAVEFLFEKYGLERRTAPLVKLELAVIQLRERKDDDSEDEYYTKLETMLVQLSELYEQVDKQSSRLIVPADAEQHPK